MKKILLLLANGFEAVEASVFTDVFGWNEFEGDGTTELVTAGLHPKLTCTWNFTVIPEMLVSDINVKEFDALAIPGGFEEANFYEDAYDERFLQVIREFHEMGKPIASICVAALSLGKSGILEGKKATTYNHPSSIRKAQLREMGAFVQDDYIVVDNNIITSSNPSTGFDVPFLLLEKLTSIENVKHVKDLMGFR
ncbi:DJ-1/PfpI family protein [Priestia megaterium]|uniref:DJ-1/PfpI family protein n=1 Tax=Priestia megaterium TaxID=1404 RepID=UPI0024529133|nr:DJ-1/PfpI family protein [Priestia megaterium]MDH3161297.1 DJ-1/PfpI family protein [Priestia megaterium]MED4116883.1 DJ-1/PfpI family protein [Priestia megaterium]